MQLPDQWQQVSVPVFPGQRTDLLVTDHPLVVEEELLRVQREGGIAGAALDVFVDEPIAADSPFWKAPNCIVSPHMSGDFIGYEAVIAQQFVDNWRRYRAGEPLANRVDKQLGFVPAAG